MCIERSALGNPLGHRHVLANNTPLTVCKGMRNYRYALLAYKIMQPSLLKTYLFLIPEVCNL